LDINGEVFYISGLVPCNYLLQIVEKLVEIVTHIDQAILEFLGDHGMRSYLVGIKN